MAYETTTVAVERSQSELRKLLTKYGASRFAFGEERDGTTGERHAAVTFVRDSYTVRMRVPLKQVDERVVGQRYMRARTKTRDEIRDELYEQEERRIWRVLAWNLKARMV